MNELHQLHKTYCDLTGLQIDIRFGRERIWFDYLKYGFTQEDLVLVIGFLKKGIASGDRRPGCLRFRNLIEQPDYFEEELAMAKKAANARTRPPATVEARTIQTHDGGSITRLDAPPAPPTAPVSIEQGLEVIKEWRKTMQGGPRE